MIPLFIVQQSYIGYCPPQRWIWSWKKSKINFQWRQSWKWSYFCSDSVVSNRGYCNVQRLRKMSVKITTWHYMCSKYWRLGAGLLLPFFIFLICVLFISVSVHANLLDISLSFSFGFMAVFQFIIMAASLSSLIKSSFENGNLGQIFA